MPCSIVGYGCRSFAGPGVEAYWNGLVSGTDHCKSHLPSDRWQPPRESIERHLVAELTLCTVEAMKGYPVQDRLGVLFASTKGCVEDFIWNATPETLARDPVAPVLASFLKANQLNPVRSLAVSHACTSSHAALFLARHWLDSEEVDSVLLVASDYIGAFVAKGFQSLRALSTTSVRPFGENRDGLQLGEASAAILLSRKTVPGVEIKGVGLVTEGQSITRPSSDGSSLAEACGIALDGERPDLIIAHGTGTPMNDRAEDLAFGKLFADTPPITATKWSIGHTLGASGAMDIIAACEALKRGTTFRIHNTVERDSTFTGNYLLRETPEAALKLPLQRVLVSSLGFGGAHAGLSLELGA